jgi:MarR family transcriptional regulator, lower aerobic nicotinate degradation pathway regulator
MKSNPSLRVNLSELPGHYVRRIHQIVVALFVQELGEINVTPVQYSSLQTICKNPGIDQGTLARTIAFDTSTIGSVIDRLEARGLVVRTVSASDKRVRNVSATAEGERLLARVVPPMLRSQELFLEPLSLKDRKVFMGLMRTLIEAHAAKGIGAALPPSE